MMNDRQISRLFWVAKAALLAVLLSVAVGGVLGPLRGDALKPKPAAGGEPAPVAMAPAIDEETPTDYAAIMNNDLFTSGDAAAPRAFQPAEAMPSADDLGLRLVGAVVFPGNSAASVAVIESEQTQAAQPYKIGDVVASATIEAIAPEQVILRYSGQKCVLMRRAAGSTTSPASSRAAARTPATGATPAAAAVRPTPQPATRLGYVEDTFRTATIEPHVEDGQVDGLTVTDLDQAPLAAAFGLRNGDVVRSVNGQDLTSKQKAFQVLQKARTQPKLDIEIVRDGQTKNLSFDL